MTKPKILWHSNSPWSPTGYGQQTGLFLPKLKEAGYEVASSSFYGLEGNMIGWKGIACLPGTGGTFGNESITGHAHAFFGDPRAGLIFTLMDVWVLEQQVFSKLNVASWCPVDHDPAPPAVRSYFENTGATPIAMSRFGEERLSDYDPLYVPHAVDTSVFKPVEESRKAAGLPESAFVCGMVAANKGNPSRKSFMQVLYAFKAFRERHDDALLALHTELQAPNGINLAQQIVDLGLEDAVHPTDQYATALMPYGDDAMAAMYSSMDVLLNPSAGEGFGIPIVEAQACGTPVIVTDFSAMKELCGAGWKVECTPHYTAQMAWQVEPSIEDILASMEEAYAMPAAQRKTLAGRARNFAMDYDIEKVLADHMLPALEEITERTGNQPKVAA